MNIWTYVAIRDTAAIAGGVYLVVQGSPWWAALCFLIPLGTSIKQGK